MTAQELTPLTNHVLQGQWRLPKEWKWIPLSEVCAEIIGGGTPRRDRTDFFGGDVVWITPSDLTLGEPDRVVTYSQTTLTELGLNSSSAKLVPPGTVLYSTRATIGKVGVAGVQLCTNQGFANLVCGDRLHNRYLAWCLHHLTDEIKKLAGSTTYLEVSKGKLKTFSIPIPYPEDVVISLETQRRIVARIETLLTEIKEARKLLDEMRRDAQRLIDAVLEEVFDERVISKWPYQKKLGRVAEIQAKQVDPRRPEYANLPHIGVNAIESAKGRLLDFRTAAEDGIRSGKYLFSLGVVLYSKIRPYLRKVAYAEFEGLCSADIYPLTVTDGQLRPEFLQWALLARPFTDYAISKSGRARMPKINRRELFDFNLRFPDTILQQQIVAHLESIRKEVEGLEHGLNKDAQILEQLQQSILKQAFSGDL